MNEPESEQPRGLVVVADGVGGLDLCGKSLRYVLAAEKLPYSVEILRWGHGLGRWLADLSDVANRDHHARVLAESLRSHKSKRPSDQIYLIAKSGGSGVVVKALELLEEQQVDRAVLLAPALSPSYDLSHALHAVRCDMTVFWSPFDVFILGAGTRVFGTVDRIKTASAGLVGFRLPGRGTSNNNEGQQYDKLRQIRWRTKMLATGHLGGHFGPDNPLFLRRYVVPLLRIEETPE
jgi:hypothetical protein